MAIVAATLVLAACTSGNAAEEDDHGVRPIEDADSLDNPDDASPEPDEADDEPEPEPEPTDPFAVPDEIDEAYVDLVMNELLSIDSAILRDVLSRDIADDLEEQDYERIRAVFSGPQLVKNGEDYLRFAMDANSRDGFLSPDELGEIRWTTHRIMEGHSACILAIGYYDLTEVSVEPYAEDQFVIASLAPVPERDDAAGVLNPTPWRLHDLNLLRAGGEPIPEKDWDRVNYEATLQATCEQSGDA